MLGQWFLFNVLTHCLTEMCFGKQIDSITLKEMMLNPSKINFLNLMWAGFGIFICFKSSFLANIF